MFGDDLLREGILGIEQLDLHEQAFLQVSRSDSRRIEFLHYREGFFHVLHGIVPRLRNFVERRSQVAVFIEISDDRVGDLADRFAADAYAQLPGEVISEAGRR